VRLAESRSRKACHRFAADRGIAADSPAADVAAASTEDDTEMPAGCLRRPKECPVGSVEQHIAAVAVAAAVVVVVAAAAAVLAVSAELLAVTSASVAPVDFVALGRDWTVTVVGSGRRRADLLASGRVAGFADEVARSHLKEKQEFRGENKEKFLLENCNLKKVFCMQN
jgi:ABC-type amino acid transport substrate-binding protein